MTEVSGAAKIITEYGYPLIISILLIWYTYDHQKKLDAKTDAREKKSEERETKYQAFISDLQHNLSTTACENLNVVRKISTDADKLHLKMQGLGLEVDCIRADVTSMKTNVQEIKTDIDHIQAVGIKIARGDEEE